VKKTRLTYEEIKKKLAEAEDTIASLRSGNGHGNGHDKPDGESEPVLQRRPAQPSESALVQAYIQSEENFRHTLDACPLGICISTEKGGIVYTNQAILDITGYQSSEEFKKVDIKQLYTPESYTAHLERKQKRAKGETVPAEYEIRIKRPDGVIRTLYVFIRKINWGGTPHNMAMYQDITDRRKMESIINHQAALVRNTSDAVISSDNEHKIISWNKGAEAMYGWRAEEVVGKTIQSVIRAEYPGITGQEFITSLQQTGSLKIELIHHRKNGEPFPALVTASLIKDGKDRENGAVTVIKDITDLKKAEEAVKASEKFLDNIIENTPSPLWVSDANGVVIRMNQALRDFLKVTDEEILGKYNVLQDEQVKEQGFLPLIKSVFEEGKAVNFTLRYQTGRQNNLKLLNDIELVMEITISPVRDENGKVTNTICQQKDISARIKVERALKESQETFLGAFQSSPGPNVIIELNTKQVISVNDALCRVLGYKREELIGKSTRELPIWCDLDHRDALLKELNEKGMLANKEIKLRVKNGDIRTFIANMVVLKLRDDPFIYISMLDMTDRKKAEEALLASEERYRSSLDNMMEGCQIIDRNWRYIYLNDAGVQQSRHKRLELIGHTMMEVFPGIEETDMFAVLKKCMEKRIAYRIENEFSYADGSNGWFDLSIQPVPEGVFVLSLDITERKKMEDRLRYHASLVESVYDALVSSDAEFKILSWNKAAEEMYGFKENEVIGKSVMDVTNALMVDSTPEKVWELLRRDNHWMGEAIHHRKNGEKINVLAAVTLMKDDEGKELGAVSIYRDVTEQHRIESAIHQNEERFRRIFQAGPVGIGLTDLECHFNMVNDRYSEMLGYTQEELRCLTYRDYSFPEDAEKVSAGLQELLKGKITHFNIDKRFIRKNGEVFWGDQTITILRDSEDKPQGFLSMTLDITGRKRDEDHINHLNLTLRSIRNVNQLITREKNRDRLIQGICSSMVESKSFENAWIVLVDEHGQPVTSTASCNSNFSSVNLFENGELPVCAQRAMKQKKVIVIEDPHKQCPECSILREKFNTGSMAVRLESEGEIYGVLCASMPQELLASEDEKALFEEVAEDIAFALRDISLRSTHDLLQQEQLRAAKLESIGTLAGGIAHDFNNLLTGIMGNIGLAKSFLPPTSDVFEVLDEAEKAATRSRDLTQQLLTFARGGKPIKKITNIVKTVSDAATFALRGSRVKLELSLPESLWEAEVDEGQISQVIHNLVINADDAMPGGGTLSITGRNIKQPRWGILPLIGGHYIEIVVRDTGTGITPEHLQKIFEPYFTTKQKGSGLGLTSAYSIIKSHGGSLLVDSVVNEGSIFRIYLPASRKTAKGEKEVASQQSPQAGGKILIMDDDEIIRKMLKNMLNLAGYEVETTADGAEAIVKYRQAATGGNPFDAVIMDLTIPGGMGGKEAIQELLAFDPNAAVVVSSGYATDPIMSEYKKYGFSAVIAKPYSIKQLQQTISNLTSRKKK
jgi:PAS domain S-box-containing protein